MTHKAVPGSVLQVHYAACGALKNISFGKEADNKIAIKNCDGVPALIRLLRKTRDQDLTDIITGWTYMHTCETRCRCSEHLDNNFVPTLHRTPYKIIIVDRMQ